MNGWVGGQKGAGFEHKSHSCHKCPSRFNPCLRFPGCPESTASLFLGAIHHHAMVWIPSSQSSLLPPFSEPPLAHSLHPLTNSKKKRPQSYACGACQDDAWGDAQIPTRKRPKQRPTQEKSAPKKPKTKPHAPGFKRQQAASRQEVAPEGAPKDTQETLWGSHKTEQIMLPPDCCCHPNRRNNR